MPHNPRTRNELRCFCSRKPLLAMYGIDDSGRLYIHVKVYKQDRIYCEMIVRYNAEASIKCRDCFRWYTVRMLQDSVKLEESKTPDEIIVVHGSSADEDKIVSTVEVV